MTELLSDAWIEAPRPAFDGLVFSSREFEDTWNPIGHPRTTMRYDRARQSLDRHAACIVATFIAGASR